MAKSPRQATLRALMLVLVGVLNGCGGGGGSSDAPSSGAPPTSSTSGLVPVAPVAGAVLEPDATTLRVLRPGAIWTYHGVDAPYPSGSVPEVYTNVVTHTGAASGINEQSSNLFNTGADVSNVQAAAGIVKMPGTIQPVPGVAADMVDGVELRSPVRENDQYTVYDRHFDDAGQDLDGDGVHEALDIAVWSRVVGIESVELPNRRQVQAVRVDATVNERVKYTKSGSFSDVYEVVRRQWYAKGIGVVKIQLEQPGPNIPSAHHITTELLDTWDGLGEGVGYLPVQAATVPTGESAGLVPSAAIDAVAFDDHAVVLSFIPNVVMAEGITLTSVDLRGTVQSSTNHHGWHATPAWSDPQRLLRVGNELRVVVVSDSGIGILGFDASGSTSTLPFTQLVARNGYSPPVDRPMVQAASTGQIIWLMWLSPNLDAQGNYTTVDLKLQQFGAAGVPVAAASTLEAGLAANAVRSMRLTASAERVFVNWNVSGLNGSQRYAAIDPASGTVLAVKTLLPTLSSAFSDPFYTDLQTLAVGSELLITMRSEVSFGSLAGVRLDASFDPLRSSTGTLGSEILSPSWMPRSYGGALLSAGEDRAFLSVLGSSQYWPDDAQTTSVQQFVELDPGTGALASSATMKMIAQVPVATLYVSHMLPYPDRVLVFGTRQGSLGTTLATTVVWRKP